MEPCLTSGCICSMSDQSPRRGKSGGSAGRTFGCPRTARTLTLRCSRRGTARRTNGWGLACGGGRGRTGTALACLAVLDGVPPLRRPGSAAMSPSAVADTPQRWTIDRPVVVLVTMTTSMSLAEAKAHLPEVVSRVSRQHERITVTVHGRPSAVLVAPEDLESLEETLAILSDPDTMRRLSASEVELACRRR